MLPTPVLPPTLTVLIDAAGDPPELDYAVESVLRQVDAGLDVVVVGGGAGASDLVTRLADDRVRQTRPAAAPHDNETWRQALDLARGDHLCLITARDGLCPSYTRRVFQILSLFSDPDLILSGLYLFRPPAVDGPEPEGFVDEIEPAREAASRGGPYLEPHPARADLLAQHPDGLEERPGLLTCLTFRKAFLETLVVEGDLFHSSRPDAYLAALAVRRAQSVIVDPCANVVVASRSATGAVEDVTHWVNAATRLLGEPPAPSVPDAEPMTRGFGLASLFRRDRAAPPQPPASKVLARKRRFSGEFATLPDLLDALEALADPVAWPQRLTVDEASPPADPDVFVRHDLLAGPVFPPPRSGRAPGARPTVDALPVDEPWAYGLTIDLTPGLGPGARWAVVRVGKTEESFGVGLLEEGGARFSERVYVPRTSRPTEIWLPLAEGQAGGQLVILNWDRPRKRALRVLDAFLAFDPAAVVSGPVRPGVLWRELA